MPLSPVLTPDNQTLGATPLTPQGNVINGPPQILVPKIVTPTIWDTRVPPFNGTTDDGSFHVASTLNVPQDGVLAIFSNIVGATEDGSDWAAFLIAEIVAVRASGVLSLFGPAMFIPSAQAGPTSATWRAKAEVAGTSVVISIQGAAGVLIKWSMHSAGNYNQAPASP